MKNTLCMKFMYENYQFLKLCMKIIACMSNVQVYALQSSVMMVLKVDISNKCSEPVLS